MTTLADTSAWIEYLRATGSPTHLRLRRLIADEGAVVTTEVVIMELLAGASNDDELSRLGRLLGRFELLPVQGLADYEAAAGLYRRCRRAGETLRKLTACPIAVVAMRAGAALLHRDQDFDVIARHAPLLVAG